MPRPISLAVRNRIIELIGAGHDSRSVSEILGKRFVGRSSNVLIFQDVTAVREKGT